MKIREASIDALVRGDRVFPGVTPSLASLVSQGGHFQLVTRSVTHRVAFVVLREDVDGGEKPTQIHWKTGFCASSVNASYSVHLNPAQISSSTFPQLYHLNFLWTLTNATLK